MGPDSCPGVGAFCWVTMDRRQVLKALKYSLEPQDQWPLPDQVAPLITPFDANGCG